ncbi:MAG: hypothetical protein U1E05_14440, partial [Patescibacteria group bacterium]|nr:hypothetical protein [Patescibacteria group bacterium]
RPAVSWFYTSPSRAECHLRARPAGAVVSQLLAGFTQISLLGMAAGGGGHTQGTQGVWGGAAW